MDYSKKSRPTRGIKVRRSETNKFSKFPIWGGLSPLLHLSTAARKTEEEIKRNFLNFQSQQFVNLKHSIEASQKIRAN